MSYRQSGYSPAAVSSPRRLVRPFDRWQWLGLALVVIGLGMALAGLGQLDLQRPVPIAGSGGPTLALSGALLLRRDADLPAGSLAGRGWGLALAGLAILVTTLSVLFPE